ncbi:MAG: low molecular weight phosphotyrosine protein phosphatase [Eubacteriales bacterium]|nr:low molecular weight phosphotyrosine protein phosphatase [Eubacteriales bacterium]
MHKILFVCHGNICRSPMAEFILKDMVQKRGMSGEFMIASAATSNEDIGSPVHPSTKKKLANRGIDTAGKTAVQMRRQDYTLYDKLIGMDGWNIKDMLRITGGDPEGKICRLLDVTDSPRDIADPWYTGDFDATYTDVVAGCEALLEQLL